MIITLLVYSILFQHLYNADVKYISLVTIVLTIHSSGQGCRRHAPQGVELYCVSSLNELMCMHVCAYTISIAYDCVSHCVVLCVVLLDTALTAATCEPRRNRKRGKRSRECF